MLLQTFAVGSETTLYNLSVSGYSYDTTLVNPGDSLSQHNGMKFSTYDRDIYGTNCAVMSKVHGNIYFYFISYPHKYLISFCVFLITYNLVSVRYNTE